MPQTATNPETGEKIQLNELTGQWERIEPAKGFQLGEMIENIPASAAQFASDVTAPIHSPIQTATGVTKLIGGLGQKVAREAQEMGGMRDGQTVSIPKGELEQYPEAMADFFKDRYGSVPAIKRTLEADPVGSLADVAGALTLGGGAISKIPKLGKAGQITQKVGAGLEPANLLLSPTKAAIGTLTPKSLPASLYKKAAKFPGNLDVKFGPGTETKLAETALKHKILPREKGVIKMTQIEKALEDTVGGLVDKATTEGIKIPKAQIYRRLKEARSRVGGVRMGAKENLAQINKEVKAITEQVKKVKGDSLTPRQMQNLKISAQSRAKYVPGTVPEKGKELANKYIGRAAKEGLEESVPGVAETNVELAKLKALSDPLKQSAARIERKDLTGLGGAADIVTGQAVGGTPGAAIGIISALTEAKKAELAMQLNALQNMGLGNLIDPSIKAALIEQGLMQTGRAGDVLKEQK